MQLANQITVPLHLLVNLKLFGMNYHPRKDLQYIILWGFNFKHQLLKRTMSPRLTPGLQMLTMNCVSLCVCSHSIFSVRILRVLDAGVPRVLDISE